jgi:hypothetical protein
MSTRYITRVLGQLGWTNGLRHMIGGALDKVSLSHIQLIRYHFVTQPVPSHIKLLVSPSATNALCLVSPVDPLLASSPRPIHEIARGFANRHLYLVAKARNQFAGFLWLARYCYQEDEVRCRNQLEQPGISIWDFDVSVKGDFRLCRTFARLWAAANEYLVSNDVRWSFSRISCFNPDSLPSHSRVGNHTIFTGTFLCYGSFQPSSFGVPPYFHTSISNASYPTVRLALPLAATLNSVEPKCGSRATR